MAYTEFYCDPVNGSNLNAGSTLGAPAYTGVGDSDGAGTFTPSDGSTPASSVNVGDFVSVYVTAGATTTVFVGRVTAVAPGVNGAITNGIPGSGVYPANSSGAHTITCVAGGAWKGPGGASAFPVNFVTNNMTDIAGDPIRVTLLNTAVYSVTSGMSVASQGIVWQGAHSTPGDGGKAVFDGGITGGSFAVFTISQTGVILRDLVVQNNGATGGSAGISLSARGIVERVTIRNMTGPGIQVISNVGGVLIEVELYNNNINNNNNSGGISIASTGGPLYCDRVFSHHNAGGNSSGLIVNVTSTTLFLHNCIFDSNGNCGILLTSSATGFLGFFSFLAVNGNSSHGVSVVPTGAGTLRMVNCKIANNGAGGAGYGIKTLMTTVSTHFFLDTCEFYNNHDGQTSGIVDAEGTITDASSPFVSSSTGNFANLLGTNAGQGTFSQTTTVSGAVTGATNANPIEVTTQFGHGLSTGNSVTISGVGGNTAANGTFTITKTAANKFTVGVAGNGAYVSGGTWSAQPYYSATTTSYPDTGAVQNNSAAAGGGAPIVGSSIVGGIR